MLDYPYFKDNYRLIGFGLSKKKSSGADVQGFVGGNEKTKIRLCTILEKSNLIIIQRSSKSFLEYINGWIK